jgi:hypothetical protein
LPCLLKRIVNDGEIRPDAIPLLRRVKKLLCKMRALVEVVARTTTPIARSLSLPALAVLHLYSRQNKASNDPYRHAKEKHGAHGKGFVGFHAATG